MKKIGFFLILFLAAIPCFGQTVTTWPTLSTPFIDFGNGVSIYGQDGKYLGELNNNRYDPNSISNPYGQYGSKYSVDSVNNRYGQYGSPYSDLSIRNPYTMQAPTLIEHDGTYLGRLSNNKYDPDSTSNRFGMFGSP